MRNLKKTAFTMVLATAFFTSNAQNNNGATAQTTGVYIGKKCPDCTLPANLQKWEYTREGVTETLKSPDFNSYCVIDWTKSTVQTEGNGSYRITRYTASAEVPKVTIFYEGLVLTLYYNQFGQYVGHTVSDEKQ